MLCLAPLLQGGAGASPVEKALSTGWPQEALGSSCWAYDRSGSAFSQGRGHLLPHVNQAPVGSVSESIASRLRGQQALCERPTLPPYTCFFCANLHSESGTPPPPSHSLSRNTNPSSVSNFRCCPCNSVHFHHPLPAAQAKPPVGKAKAPTVPDSPAPPSGPSPWLLLLPDLLLLSRSNSFL